MRFAPLLGLGALLAALPLSMTASIITVDFTFSLNGDPGSASAVYDTSYTPLTDAHGTYVDASDGLSSMDVTYGGFTYNLSDAIGYSPELLLPGNTLVGDGSYGFLADWFVNGTGGIPGATILGIGDSIPAYLAVDVTQFLVNGTPSTTLYLGFDQAPPPAGSFISGTVTSPEPALLPLLALGLAGLWFARRRKAIL